MTVASVRQATMEDYLGETTKPNEPLAEPATPTVAAGTEQATESAALMIEVHPFAARFPMLSDDEIADLAEDIKANGLIHPIVLDAEGLLIDGRNRLRACEIAGVEPRFTTYEGEDPVAFILSVNLNRRHMSKGQKTMMSAIGLVSKKYKNIREAGGAASVAFTQVGHALVVLDYAPDLADSVISGAMPLNDAYKVAQERKTAADSAEAQLAKLRVEAPDLADQVVEERLALREALAALRERIETARSARKITTDTIDKALTFIGPINPMWSPEQSAAEIVSNLDPELLPSKPEFSPERLRRAAAVLEAMANRIEKGS